MIYYVMLCCSIVCYSMTFASWRATPAVDERRASHLTFLQAWCMLFCVMLLLLFLCVACCVVCYCIVYVCLTHVYIYIYIYIMVGLLLQAWCM